MSRTGTVARPSSHELGLARLRDRDELVEHGRQLEEGVPVGLGADAARVRGRDQIRPPLAGLAERDDRAGRDGLGAVHVGVDDVGTELREVSREGADRDRIVGLVDDQHAHARALELADRAPRRQRRRPRRRSGPDPSESRARRGAPGRRRSCRSRGPRPRGSAGRRELRAVDRRQARIERQTGALISRSCVGRAAAGSVRPAAPHSYL